MKYNVDTGKVGLTFQNWAEGALVAEELTLTAYKSELYVSLQPTRMTEAKLETAEWHRITDFEDLLAAIESIRTDAMVCLEEIVSSRDEGNRLINLFKTDAATAINTFVQTGEGAIGNIQYDYNVVKADAQAVQKTLTDTNTAVTNAETLRANAEKDRVETEKARNEEEKARQAEEDLRKENEEQRKTDSEKQEERMLAIEEEWAHQKTDITTTIDVADKAAKTAMEKAEEAKGIIDKGTEVIDEATQATENANTAAQRAEDAYETINQRTLNVNLVSINQGNRLPAAAPYCNFNFTGYPCHSVPVYHDYTSYEVVCCYHGDKEKGQYYYVFLDDLCSFKYTDQNVPQWIKDALWEYNKPIVLTVEERNGNYTVTSSEPLRGDARYEVYFSNVRFPVSVAFTGSYMFEGVFSPYGKQNLWRMWIGVQGSTLSNAEVIVEEVSDKALAEKVNELEDIMGMYDDRQPITLVADMSGKAIVPITTGSEYGKVADMAGASVSREYNLTRGDLLKIKPGKTSNALFTVSQVVTNKDGSKTYTKVMSLNEAAEVPNDGYLNFLVMPSDMTVVITFFSGEPDFNATVRVMRCGTFASICTQVGNIYNELHSQYMRIDGYSALARVGLADNLASKGEASAETIRYRKSGGENAIESGTATVEKIKGKTVVMNQCINYKGHNSSYDNITIALSDGKLVINGTSTSGKNSYPVIQETTNTISGHKYIAICRYNKNIDNNDMRVYDDKKAVFSFYTSGASVFTSNGDEFKPYFSIHGGVTFDNVEVSLMISDLTQMFGAGNEPSTPEEFAKRLGYNSIEEVPYMEYNEGELVNNCVEGVKTTGFNLWDEQWEAGGYSFDNGKPATQPDRIRNIKPIHVIGGSTLFCINSKSFRVSYLFYDKDMRYISYVDRVGTIKVSIPSNASYINLFVVEPTYTSKTCINYDDPAKNGTYEPRWESVRSWKETINRYFPEGMKASLDGSVFDEIGSKKAVKRFGVVDLGELNFSKVTDDTYLNVTVFRFQIKDRVVGLLKGITPLYETSTSPNRTGANVKDMVIGPWNATDKTMYIRDDAKASMTEGAFKTAMRGVKFIYELETPEEYEYDELNLSYKVDAGGTEEAVIPEGKESTALSADVVYGIDAWGTIKSNKERITEAEGKPAMTLTAEEVTKLRALINVSSQNLEE